MGRRHMVVMAMNGWAGWWWGGSLVGGRGEARATAYKYCWIKRAAEGSRVRAELTPAALDFFSIVFF